MSINVLNTPESVVSLVTPKLKITGNSGTPKLDLLTNFFEGLTTEEQSGDLVSFENTVGLPLPFVSVKADITAQQDLHGQANPYPAGGGINIWDEQWEQILYNASGAKQSSNAYIGSKNYIPVSASTAYCFLYLGVTTATSFFVCWYTSDKTFIQRDNAGVSHSGVVMTSPSNASYMNFCVGSGTNPITTYANNISINYPSTDKAYHPYSNICPITGFTGANVYDDGKYDKTIYWNQLAQIAVGTGNGVTITQDDDGVVSLSGVAQGSKTVQLNNIQHISGHSYLFLFSLLANPNNLTFTIGMGAGNPWISTIHDVKSYDRIYANTYTTHLGLYDITGKDVTGVKFLVEICDLTAMFGAGNEPTIAEFKELFPKDYYAYNAGETSLVSKVNGDPYREVNITWTEQGTIYGGTIDFTTGVLTVTHEYQQLKSADVGTVSKVGTYASVVNITPTHPLVSHEDLSIPDIISDSLPTRTSSYLWANEEIGVTTTVDGTKIRVRLPNVTTASEARTYLTNNSIYTCSKLATPVTYQLTPTQVKTLLGQNNVWSDCGEVDVTYYARA